MLQVVELSLLCEFSGWKRSSCWFGRSARGRILIMRSDFPLFLVQLLLQVACCSLKLAHRPYSDFLSCSMLTWLQRLKRPHGSFRSQPLSLWHFLSQFDPDELAFARLAAEPPVPPGYACTLDAFAPLMTGFSSACSRGREAIAAPKENRLRPARAFIPARHSFRTPLVPVQPSPCYYMA
jgi:hypothetical protein